MKKPSRKAIKKLPARKEVTCRILYAGKSFADSDNAFHTTFEVEIPADSADEALLNVIFAGFNAGSGREWNLFRFAHIRSMSTGDMVSIDGRWYECASCGWAPIPAVKALAHFNEVLDTAGII